jgi:hypothetical protein
MDRQQIFDLVSAGLLLQARKSYRSVEGFHGKLFAYRGEGNCKCAAGFLIPDQIYSKEMEGHLWPDAAFNRVRHLARISVMENGLVIQLQWVHDCSEPISWREELAALGRREHLEIGQIWPLSHPTPHSKRD